ncbi:class I SAM-dependent methyltransferase [Sinorhizobium meliloti]|nr:class I SAM-dependent methyltransferase [Sinorhizobium meliloti]
MSSREDVKYMQAIAYPDDYPTFDAIAAGAANRDYRPTLVSGFINDRHKWYVSAPTAPGSVAIVHQIPGKLRRGDASKLYEMAYMSQGDILELGTYKGLSSTIMGEALRDARKPFQVYTADLNEEFVERAKAAHVKMRLTNVHTHVMEGGAFTKSMKDKRVKFGFAFIDHWHGYDATVEVCQLLPDIMMNRGFVLFHDFTHIGNVSDDPAFGVIQAVEDTLSKDFKFFGIFGCCALFRYEPKHS